MSGMKAKDSRAPSSARDGSVRLQGRPELDPFRGGAEAVDISLHGLLYPKSSEEEEDEEEEEPQRRPEGEERGPSSQREGSGSPPDRDALDSVLDTFLAPAAHVSSASAPAAWCLFGAELPGALMSRRSEHQPGETAAAHQDSPAANSGSVPPPAAASSLWPGGGTPAAAAKLPPQREGEGTAESAGGPRSAPEALSEEDHGFASGGPAEQDAGSGSSLALAPAFTAAPGSSAAAAGPGQDFLHVPILPLNSAYLAARTRQLLDVEEYESSLFGRRASPTSTPHDFADYVYLQSDSKEEHYSSGDFQPALKIKEEGISATTPYLGTKTTPAVTCTDYRLAAPQPRASQESSSLECILYKTESSVLTGPYGPPHCKASGSSSCMVQRDSLPSTSTAPQALYQPLSLNGHQQLGFQTAVLKESLPQLYPPYANYIRPDTEVGQSPQYSFESLPQKICLICGDEASGCHYGVLTCGSCKVFFKRAMEAPTCRSLSFQANGGCVKWRGGHYLGVCTPSLGLCHFPEPPLAWNDEPGPVRASIGRTCGPDRGAQEQWPQRTELFKNQCRKFKKFNKVKVVRTLDIVALQQPVALPDESQALTQRISFSPNQEIQFIPQLISILQGIEPEVVYAGYDNTQPETPSALLTSLNQLCERQLLCVVKWSKSLPGFRSLHIDDQITLIQYSWMSLMVFAMGWRSYKHVSGQMLYFAPDLILNEQRMKESSFYSLCLSMWQIPQEFVKLQVSPEEFLCMKSLLLLNTIPLEGLRSQSQFDEMRASYVRELVKAVGLRQKGVVASSQRFYQLTKLMDSMHDARPQWPQFAVPGQWALREVVRATETCWLPLPATLIGRQTINVNKMSRVLPPYYPHVPCAEGCQLLA
ncbi:Progesterone receptor [Chelonia mydas]|uniref:Progesterone receptor n=1 Tax=Chelonia mydas TaxID=8469 RepID=M7BG00_CHEMY|nr:Progesterone receptor [Chelonia mydas]